MQRRREQRYEVWESVVVSLAGSTDASHRPATIVDISKSGYRVLFGARLDPGTEILTTLHSVAIFGVVRHCEEAAENTFTAGVEITKVVAESDGSADQSAPAAVSTAGV